MLRKSHALIVQSLAGAFCLAALSATAVADDDNTNGVVEPAIVLIESDPNDSAKFEQYRDVPDGLTLPHFNLQWEASTDPFGGGMWVDLDAIDVSEQDQRINLSFGSRGLWKGTLTWSENPHLYGDTGRMLQTYQGGGVFTIVDALQTAFEAGGTVGPQTPSANPTTNLGNPFRGQNAEHTAWAAGTKGAILRDAMDTAAEVLVGYQRETGGIAFEFTPTKAWRFGFSAERERREGTKPSTHSFGFAAVTELASPVDYETDTLSLNAEYSGRNWVLGARYLWSDFEIGQDRVIWDNIQRDDDTATASSRGQYLLGTDNEMDQWQLYFGVNLPGHTRIDATASQANTTQNDEFLPQTINPVIQALANYPVMPADRLHGDYDNNLLDFRINSRPLDWLRLKGWWRNYEQDNNTPVLELPGYVAYDTSIPGNSNPFLDHPAGTRLMRANMPYGYEKTNFGLLAGFAPADWVEFALSWEREDMERHHAAVEDSRDDTWKLTADFDVTDKLFFRAGYSQSERNAHEYHSHYVEESFPNGESVAFGFNEGGRKFYQTDRDLDTWSLMFEYTPVAKFSIYGEAKSTDGDYKDPDTGLRIGDSYELMEDRTDDNVDNPTAWDIRLAGRTHDESDAYTLGFSIRPNDAWDIYLDHTWEDVDWGMASRYRGVSGNIGDDDPLNNWDTEVQDEYSTFSLGFHGRWAEDRWEVKGDVTVHQATGNIYTSFVPGGSSSSDTALLAYPELDNDFTVATLGFERHLANGWDVGFTYWYESWESDDWQSDYNAAYIGNPDQAMDATDWQQLGLDFADYENHILMLMARYHF